MAGRNQLLLLVERGTLLDAFERLWEYAANPQSTIAFTSYYSSTKSTEQNDRSFKQEVLKTEVDYSYELAEGVSSGQLPRLPYASAFISLVNGDLNRPSVEVELSSHEPYLLFPELYGDFNLVILNVRGAKQLQGEEHSDAEEMTRKVLEIVNFFRPYYGFHTRDNTVYPRSVWLHEMSAGERAAYRTKFRQAPWHVFNRVMVFGEKLSETIGQNHLLATPARHKLKLSDTTFLWGPRGLLDEGSLEFDYLEYDLDQRRWFFIDYTNAVAEHLNLSVEYERINYF